MPPLASGKWCLVVELLQQPRFFILCRGNSSSAGAVAVGGRNGRERALKRRWLSRRHPTELQALCTLMRVCCACRRACAVRACARKSSGRIEPLSHSEPTSWRGLPVKTYLQAGAIVHCQYAELHSLVPFLIDGFVSVTPGCSARMNPIDGFMLLRS